MRTPTCRLGVVLVMLGTALTLMSCERAPVPRDQKAPTVIWPSKTQSAKPQPAQSPRVGDHPLVHRGRDGHLAGSPVAGAGVRCFRQVPRSGPEGDAWFYCVADGNMNIDAPRTLPPERTDVRIASAVTVHPVENERHGTEADEQMWTFRRVDVAGATVKVLGTEFLGRFLGQPGHRIGYVMSADGRGGMYGRTVFELRDPTTKEYIGALCVIVTRFP